MRADIATLDVAGRIRSLIGYAVGLAVYTVVVVALYPAFRHSTSLDTLVHNDATAAALFGVTGKISTSGGWLNANIYANLFPLVMLLLTIGYGAAAIAGQNEDGTLGLTVTLPVRRTTIVVQKLWAMVAQGGIVAVVLGVCVLVGRGFGLSVSVADAAAMSLAVLLMALDFGLVTMAVGAHFGRRGVAIGVGTALAAASYLLSSLAPVASWLAPARYGSLFYWSVGNDQVASGVSIGQLGVLVGVGVLATLAAGLAFDRLDVR